MSSIAFDNSYASLPDQFFSRVSPAQVPAPELIRLNTDLAHSLGLDADWLAGDLTWYSGFMKADMTRPKAACVLQLFNHQTHHRGQVHAMLTAAGTKPEDTDIPFMPDEIDEWP